MNREKIDVAQKELLQEEQMGGPVNCSCSELCTFLQGLAEGFLPTYYSVTSQSVQLKSIAIASKSWRHGKKMGAFPGFPSLQMSRNLTGSHGEGLLTWFLAGFPAKTSALPEKGLESREIVLGSGKKWRESFAKFDRATSSWKTPRFLPLAGLMSSSVIWPRWGSMRNGACSELPTPVLRTKGTESGFWPTPRAQDREGLSAGMRRDSPGLAAVVRTPSLWPTPTVNGNYNRKGASRNSGDGLATIVKMFPTPAARDYRSPNSKPFSELGGGAKGEQLQNAIGGQLNPDWVEWLMGWPVGWTDLGPLNRTAFREWREAFRTESVASRQSVTDRFRRAL